MCHDRYGRTIRTCLYQPYEHGMGLLVTAPASELTNEQVLSEKGRLQRTIRIVGAETEDAEGIIEGLARGKAGFVRRALAGRHGIGSGQTQRHVICRFERVRFGTPRQIGARDRDITSTGCRLCEGIAQWRRIRGFSEPAGPWRRASAGGAVIWGGGGGVAGGAIAVRAGLFAARVMARLLFGSTIALYSFVDHTRCAGRIRIAVGILVGTDFQTGFLDRVSLAYAEVRVGPQGF